MALYFLMYFFIFVFGLCIGSFLNCVIYRTEEEKSFLKGRSFCPHCKHELNWTDLFPVFSLLFLGGKCRYCRAKISWQYPAVEIVTALIFLFIFNAEKLQDSFFLFYIAAVLIIIFVYDLKHSLIPDSALFLAIIVSIIYRIFELLNFLNWNLSGIGKLGLGISDYPVNYFYAVLIASGFFFLLWLVSKGKWMGFGDVKLAVLLGLVLGFPNILVALFLAFFFGAIIGVVLMSLNKKNIKSEVPFGPFLIFGTFLALFFGQQIINWYLGLILF